MRHPGFPVFMVYIQVSATVGFTTEWEIEFSVIIFYVSSEQMECCLSRKLQRDYIGLFDITVGQRRTYNTFVSGLWKEFYIFGNVFLCVFLIMVPWGWFAVEDTSVKVILINCHTPVVNSTVWTRKMISCKTEVSWK